MAARNEYVAKALAERPNAEETALARACDVANASEDIRMMEQEFDFIATNVAEPSTDEPPR